MLAKRNKLTIIGAVLIIIQLISILSVSCSVTGLYPGHEHLKQDGYLYDFSLKDDFEPYMIPIAMNAGFEKFVSSFGEIFTVNSSGKILSPVQHRSAVYRSALYYSGKFNDLTGIYKYDLILTVSYSLVGIVGLGLLIAGIIVERRNLKKNQRPVEDMLSDDCENLAQNQ